MARAPKPPADIKPVAEKAPAAEPPSRRLRRVDRTFTATTSELKIVVRHLAHARQVILDSLAEELRKPATKRLPDDMVQDQRDETAMLERVIREMSAIR